MDKSGYLLIDTPREAVFDIFLEELKKREISLDEIRFIFITHHHHDHAGSISKILEYTNAGVILSDRAVDFIEEGNGLHDDFELYNTAVKYVRYYAEYKQGVKDYIFTPFRIRKGLDLVVSSDTSDDHSNFLKRLGISGKIIRTPGHTECSISLLLDSGDIFVGDAAMNFLLYDWLFRWGKIPIIYQNIEEVYDSWKRIKDVGAKRVFPGHGLSFQVSEFDDSLHLNEL